MYTGTAISSLRGPRWAHSLPPFIGTMRRQGGTVEFTRRPGAFFLRAPGPDAASPHVRTKPQPSPSTRRPPDIFRRYCGLRTSARWHKDQGKTRPPPGAFTAWRIGRCGAAPWRPWPTGGRADCRSADAARRTACRGVWRLLPRKRRTAAREWRRASACRGRAD